MVGLPSCITCFSRASRFWDQFQVELQGRFTLDKIEQMRHYVGHTSQFRSLLLGVLTPVPALVAMTLTDCIPLVSATEDTNHNYTFWIRMFIAAGMMIAGLVNHFRCCVPSLRITYWQVFYVAFVSTVSGVAFGYVVSVLIGFPVPFVILVGSMAATPSMVIMFVRLWRPILRGNSALQHALRQQIMVLVGQVALIWIYPLYLFAFMSMDSMGQHIFILALTIIKIILKNYFSRMLHQLHDCKPAFIIFNADVFNALYVANSLQTSQSFVNTLVVMLVDIAQMTISMNDVRAAMTDIHSLVQLDKLDGSLLDICVTMAKSPGVSDELDKRASCVKMVVATVHPIDREPGEAWETQAPRRSLSTMNDLAQLPASLRACLVSSISKVLYMAEFILLVEFVEVIIPLLYGMYLGAMSHLPNQAYYPRLASLNADELDKSIATVMLNALLEFISFLVACWLLHRQLRISSFRLMSFALESQRSLVQSSLLVWTLHVTQQALVHSGVDFTLQFVWLRQKNR